jgi:hypothetical protein
MLHRQRWRARSAARSPSPRRAHRASASPPPARGCAGAELGSRYRETTLPLVLNRDIPPIRRAACRKRRDRARAASCDHGRGTRKRGRRQSHRARDLAVAPAASCRRRSRAQNRPDRGWWRSWRRSTRPRRASAAARPRYASPIRTNRRAVVGPSRSLHRPRPEAHLPAESHQQTARWAREIDAGMAATEAR